MRIHTIAFRALIMASAAAAAACSSATATSATLVLNTEPDFLARVSRVEFESAYGPAGQYAQYDIWVIIPPASEANAGVVLPTSAPVFLQSGAGLVTAGGDQIRVGDQIQVWRDRGVAYGAVQGPPGSPTYRGMQIVIVR